MLDPKFVKDHVDLVAQAALHKGFAFDSAAYIALYEHRRTILHKVEELRKARNEGTHTVQKASTQEARHEAVAAVKRINQELAEAESQWRQVEEDFRHVLLKTPIRK